MLVSVCSFAQNVFPGKFVDKPPTIDGIVNDDEWAGVPSIKGDFDMETGAAGPYGTQYWIAFDKNFIYVAAKLPDPDPKLIHANEYRSNVSLNGDDYLIVGIDPFSTLSDTNQFEVNPRGATNIRIAGGRAAKREWLGEFLAKARITQDGWEAEARIPWGIMRLPAPGIHDLRVAFGRVVQHTGRVFLADNISGGKGTNIAIWKQVDVPKSTVRRSLKLLPYAYLGADRSEGIANGGLDLKAPITDQLDLVGSINPDFRNIENQVLSIDFSYFERLAGESRPFFLEGANYFQTSRDAPLFVSQRIANFDAGAKVYGKLSQNSTLALLNTTDFSRQNDLAGAFTYNFSAKTNSTVAFTDLESPGLSNKATFLSLNHEFGPFAFFGQHMTSVDTVDGSGHRYNTGITYNQGGISNDIEYVEISPKYLPRLGFAPERDLKGFLDDFEFSHPTKWGKVSEWGANFSVSDLRTFEHTSYRRAISGGGSLAFVNGAEVQLGGHYQEFGGFKDRYLTVDLVYPRNDPYRSASLEFVGGNIAGHSYRSVSPAVRYRPWKNLQIAASYQRVDHFDLQEQTILSANYELGLSDSISGRAIRRGNDTNFYLAYRRTGNKGNEYYLIIGDPNSLTFRSSIIVKAVIPIEIRF